MKDTKELSYDYRYCGPDVVQYYVYSKTGEYVRTITVNTRNISGQAALRNLGLDPEQHTLDRVK